MNFYSCHFCLYVITANDNFCEIDLLNRKKKKTPEKEYETFYWLNYFAILTWSLKQDGSSHVIMLSQWRHENMLNKKMLTENFFVF